MIAQFDNTDSADNCWREDAKLNSTVVIGAIAPLSGGSAYIGLVVSNGIELARGAFLASEEYQSAQYRPDFELDKLNDGGEEAEAQRAFELLYGRGCAAIVGPVDSPCASSVAALAKAKQLVVVSPAATASYLVDPTNMWFFRAHSSDRKRAKELAAALARDVPNGRVMVLHESQPRGGNSLFGASLAQELNPLLGQEHLTLVDVLTYLREDSPSELERRVKAKEIDWSHIDAIAILGRSRECLAVVNVLRSFRPSQSKPVYLVSPNKQQFQAANPKGPIYAVNDATDEAASSLSFVDFERRYKERFPADPFSEYAAFGYDAATIVLAAILRAYNRCHGKLPALTQFRKFVRDEVESTPQHRTGTITHGSFTRDRELNLQSVLLSFRNGKWQNARVAKSESRFGPLVSGVKKAIDQMEQHDVIRVLKILGPAVGVGGLLVYVANALGIVAAVLTAFHHWAH